MAQFGMHVSIVSGGAMGEAGYGRGEKLEPSGHANFERNLRDRSKGKEDVRSSELLVPAGYEHLLEGDLAAQLQRVWGAVEEREKSSTHPRTAQYARQYMLWLPRELTPEAQGALVREWARTELVERGMIAQLSIHEGHFRGGVWNPHAHIMATMRKLAPVPEGGFAADKSLTELFGNKETAWNKRELLQEFRFSWERAENRALEAAGSDERVSCLSYKARGIDREPMIHKGPIATAIDARGGISAKAMQNAEIEARNNGMDASEEARSEQSPSIPLCYQLDPSFAALTPDQQETILHAARAGHTSHQRFGSRPSNFGQGRIAAR